MSARCRPAGSFCILPFEVNYLGFSSFFISIFIDVSEVVRFDPEISHLREALRDDLIDLSDKFNIFIQKRYERLGFFSLVSVTIK